MSRLALVQYTVLIKSGNSTAIAFVCEHGNVSQSVPLVFLYILLNKYRISLISSMTIILTRYSIFICDKSELVVGIC